MTGCPESYAEGDYLETKAYTRFGRRVDQTGLLLPIEMRLGRQVIL